MRFSILFLALSLAFRSIPFTGRLYFASDFWLDERTAKECGASELFNHVSYSNYKIIHFQL